jgi:hypothetical protein
VPGTFETLFTDERLGFELNADLIMSRKHLLSEPGIFRC